MPLTMSRLTREYVFWPAETQDDLTHSTAEVAFIDNPIDIPSEGDWKPAEVMESGMGNWAIRALVGPGHQDSIDLTPSGPDLIDYESWVRLTDNPERIVRRTGVVTIL